MTSSVEFRSEKRELLTRVVQRARMELWDREKMDANRAAVEMERALTRAVGAAFDLETSSHKSDASYSC